MASTFRCGCNSSTTSISIDRTSLETNTQQAGLPNDVRWYDLRHTTASLLLSRGTNPKIVAERLGHASVNLTPNVYSQTIPSMQHEAAYDLEKDTLQIEAKAMSVSPGKPLVEMTEQELFALLRQVSDKERYLHFTYNDILHELERKRMVKEARNSFRLSIAAIIIAVASLVISNLLAIFARGG